MAVSLVAAEAAVLVVVLLWVVTVSLSRHRLRRYRITLTRHPIFPQHQQQHQQHRRHYHHQHRHHQQQPQQPPPLTLQCGPRSSMNPCSSKPRRRPISYRFLTRISTALCATMTNLNAVAMVSVTVAILVMRWVTMLAAAVAVAAISIMTRCGMVNQMRCPRGFVSGIVHCRTRIRPRPC